MAVQQQPTFESEEVILAVNEFYTTTNEQRRNELNQVLCKFKSGFDCLQTVATCMRMISSQESSANVRYFGTVCLYDVIRLRSEEWVPNITIQMSIKTFLIEKLTAGTYAQTQSVMNKMSSSLALLALYCIPDLWSEPVADLTALWAATPELLLKVLSDMAAEFSHVNMPLNQRSKLKTELHRLSDDIRKIIWTVLSCGETTPSTKQAAVDCVEQWIRLPGVVLDNWAQVLSIVLEAVVQDCAALTNILNILSENDELSQMHQLLLDICNYVVVHVSQIIAEELKEDGCSEEATSLVSAICNLTRKAVPTLVDVATQAKNVEILSQIVQVMQALANMPGQYPVDEKVSDLPSYFLTSLREEICMVMNSEKKCDPEIVNTVAQSYAQILQAAIYKISYPTQENFEQMTHEDQDLFNDYRLLRSEVSVDSYNLSGSETLTFLNLQLDEALRAGDVNRSEAILFLWECVGDYLSDKDFPNIVQCLQTITTHLIVARDTQMSIDLSRRGNTLMRLFYALSHLVQAHDQAKELEAAVISVILSYIPTISDPKKALNSLEKYVGERSEVLEDLGENISQTCYQFFNDSSHSKELRLTALKCIGYVLSTKQPKDTMEIICRILNQHVGDWDSTAGQTDDEKIDRYSFQINIFSALFESLTLRKRGKVEASSNEEEPAIVLVLREAVPLFERICSQMNGGRLVNDVCDAVRCGLTSLPDKYVPLFFPFVASLLNSALLTNAKSACALAKSTVLQCNGLVGLELVEGYCRWFQMFEQRSDDQQLDEWLALIYQIVKKDWKTMREFKEQSAIGIRSVINLCSNTIVQSSEPYVVRTASQILACIASHTTSNDDAEIKNILAKYGADLIRAIFARVQCELMRQTVEALAEVLFFYFKQFTTETREVVNNEPYGSTPLVAAMFRDIGNLRNFKQMTIRFNNAAIMPIRFNSSSQKK